MAKVFHYVPDLASKFICSKGGLHAEEPLNTVCLDPLCRNDPLACSVCFSQIHKHHRVISVDKFIDQYARNVKNINQKKALKKIEKHHNKVKDLIHKLRQDINKKLDQFEQSIDSYAAELNNKANMREQIGASLGISLEPTQVRESRSNQQLKETLKFILNNSLFDSSNNMIRVADILKKDEERIYALLDKMVNMTQYCSDYIKDVVKTLDFSDQTNKTEKIALKAQLSAMNINEDQYDQNKYHTKEIINKAIQQNVELNKLHWRQTITKISIQNPQNNSISALKFAFSQNNKHSMIEVKNKSSIGVSNITALKPQYALLTPHLNTMPNQAKQWTLKINNCRNFASENTMGIGLATLKDLTNCNFEGLYPSNATLLTSQGFVFQKGNSRKTNLIFGAGDILYCKYDPYYKLFEISKQNGRKLTLTVDNPQNQGLFICVRLTYASDQVQIL